MKKIEEIINGKKRENEKICPFQSRGEKETICNPKCALYRKNKQKGYECPFTELTSISWIIREITKRK